MAVERKFINEAVKKAKVDSYLHEELKRVGCGYIDIKRTPLGTRIVIYAKKPGLVIGRKGKNIQTITETLKNEFKIDNPQLEVKEVPVPQLDPEIMAKQLAATLESGTHFRRASHQMIKEIMNAGALGVQIEISGKISGARARVEKFKQGYIKHCGETADRFVKEAVAQAYLKPGVLGVKVKIVPPLEGGTIHELAFGKPNVPVSEDKPKDQEAAKAEEQPKKEEGKTNKKAKSHSNSKKSKSKPAKNKKESKKLSTGKQ